MTARSVRLDDEAEKALSALVEATGQRPSELLRKGILALHREHQAVATDPFDLYRQLDLGPGGYAIAPSTEVRRGVREALRRRRQR